MLCVTQEQNAMSEVPHIEYVQHQRRTDTPAAKQPRHRSKSRHTAHLIRTLALMSRWQ